MEAKVTKQYARKGKRWLKKLFHVPLSAEKMTMVDFTDYTIVDPDDVIRATRKIVPDGDRCFVWYVIEYKNTCAFDLTGLQRALKCEIKSKSYYIKGVKLRDLIQLEEVENDDEE